MKKILLLLGVGCLNAVTAMATVNFDLEAERLDTAANTPMPTSGLVLLVADTLRTGFAPVTAGSLAVGSFTDRNDDLIVGRFDLAAAMTPGLLLENPTYTLFGNWNTGDPLALFWFPTLSLASTAADVGNSYGAYTTGNTNPLNGSNDWLTPADPSTAYKLYFFTTDAPNLPGSNSAISGDANLIVIVPEPSSFVMLAVAGLSVGLMVRRRTAL